MSVSTMAPARRYPHRVIRASAGTGKTFRLSNRFLALLFDGVSPERILATTFTRKAAGEILYRVLWRLAEAAGDAEKRGQLAEFISQENQQADGGAARSKQLDLLFSDGGEGGGPLPREECLELLAQLVKSPHRLRVGTLDSFFARLAGSFSLELKLPPAWEIVEDVEDARMRTEAIESLLRSSEAREALTLVHLLTKGEASRGVAELIRATVNNLYDIFRETDAHADEDAWRTIQRPTPPAAAELEKAKAVLAALRHDHRSKERARVKDVELIEKGDWAAFINGGMAAKILAGESSYYRQPIDDHLLSIYNPLIAQAKYDILNKIALRMEGCCELLEKFHGEYQRLKRQRGGLQFQDVALALAGAKPTQNVERLAYRLDGRIDHLLLDEFQDTSPVQWQVLEPFAKRVTAVKQPRSFFCVGDVKQAIYAWRGGVAEIFGAVEKLLTEVKPEPLTESFRSAPAVIECVNELFANLTRHPNLESLEEGVARWQKGFEEHSTSKTDLSGYACLETSDDEDVTATLAFAAERVAELVRQAPGKSVGVLVRKNESVGKMINFLRARRIPASEEGGNPLIDSAAVQIILSLLKLADHPSDMVARFHLAHSPLAGALGYRDYRDDKAADQLSQTVRGELADHGYGPSIHRWSQALLPHAGRRETARLRKLAELAYGYHARATLRTTRFIEFIHSERVADPSAADVRVMTIHQSKGLQFDIVVLPEWKANVVGQRDAFLVHRPDPTGPPRAVLPYLGRAQQVLLPPRQQRVFAESEISEVVESLCVLYVAVTRAIHALHIIIPPSPENEKTMPRSFAGLMRAALCGTELAPPKKKLYERGRADWAKIERELKKSKTPQRNEQAPAPSAAAPLSIQLAAAGGRRTRNLERTSPSGLEGGTTMRLSVALDRDKEFAADRGTLFHAWFEQIKWLEDGEPDAAELLAVARRIGVAKMSCEKLLAEFRERLFSPGVARVLRRGAYDSAAELPLPSSVTAKLAGKPLVAEVACEQAFAIREGDRLLTGTIDRLVKLKLAGRIVAADIIDFKTDAVKNEADIQDKVGHYRPQLAAYRRAVARQTGLAEECIAARLLFVAKGIVRSVE